ncbi:hypothetical protein D9Q98_007057 [Chlorella vulgaris]|uniref:Methyltransferase type 11 domain-containing protein n=1 Tax=Chlorella vulgaris TaxID=3077 RepID=A0A9D4TJD6_CHLVU|nr:hypothetical protein D9Q98_007057 [Chlorella vulgaris]
MLASKPSAAPVFPLRRLAQGCTALILAYCIFELGRRSSTAPQSLLAPLPTVGKARPVAAGLTHGGDALDALSQVDVEYDVVAAMKKPSNAAAKWTPARREGFKAPENSNAELYDQMWTGKHTYRRNGCWACRFAPDIVARLPFETVLDAGTGNGQMVRWMRMHGKAAFGVELSQAVLDRDAPDLLEAGFVEQGSLTDLPYQDNQFDLVVSGDVLEHILPEQADDVVSELVRVSKRHIVISISLKSHGNERLHTLLRPRHWWEAKFQKHGARPNRALFWALQEKQVRFSRDKGELESCRQEGVEDDGGKFEVCLVKLPWLMGIPGMDYRQIRTITPANAEVEPWFFVFTKDASTVKAA